MSSKKISNRNKIVVAIVGVVVAALAVALFAGGTDDSTSDGSVPIDSSSPSDGGASGDTNENQPVEVIGTALPPLAATSGDPAVGMTAPTLNGSSFDGTPVSVTPGDGKAYMVVFLAHWCPHCNAEVPRLIKWKESGSVPEGLEVIGISTSVASDRPNYPPSAWALAAGWPWQVMADSVNMDAAAAFGVSGFPFIAVIGEDGTVKVRTSGELSADELDQILASALG